MTFKPALWRPIAFVLSVVNLVAVGFAAGAAEPQDRLEALEVEVDNLGRELGETQERLDFAERVLAQRPEPPRVGPER